MASLPVPLLELMAALGKLPGIGPRSAERLALFLVQAEQGLSRHLAQAIVQARERVQCCVRCGGLTEHQPCFLCSDDRRDRTLLCVVERPVDVLLVEKAGTFRGGFHVLGGKLSPINGVEPEDLRIVELETRLREEPVSEVLLALPTDVEGDATCFYLAKRLGHANLRISRLAHGLPAGTGLEFADELTLGRAIQGRQAM